MRNSVSGMKKVSLFILVLALLVVIPGVYAFSADEGDLTDIRQKTHKIESFGKEAYKIYPPLVKTAKQEIPKAPAKDLPPLITDNQHATNLLPNSRTDAQKLPKTEVFDASALMDYTTITVPSTHSMVFDGNEDTSWTGCYGKGYRFWGNAGQTVQICMDSTDIDSFLVLYDSNFNLLAYDDDGGGDYNARINYDIPNSDYYYIAATMYANRIGLASLSINYAEYIFYDTNGSYDGP